MTTEQISGFGMKNSLSLTSLGWKYYKCAISKKDEPI